MNFGEAVAVVVQSIVLPYGYTLSIWSAGILAAFRYGAPKRVDPLLFVVGAVIGFMLFNIPTYWSISGQEQLDVEVPTVALLNIVPLAAVVASTLLMRLIETEWLGYLLSGFSATVVYVGSLSLLLWLLG